MTMPFFYAYALASLSSATALFFPFAALFGFYDNRKEATYRFRTGRFFTLSIILAVFPICVTFALMGAIGNLVSGSAKNAEIAANHNRFLTLYIQSSLSVALPDIFDQRTEACYTAAISNFVEDRWRTAYRTASCKVDTAFCSDEEETFFNTVRHQRNPYHFPFLDFDAMGLMLHTVWSTAKDTYDTARSFYGIQDPTSIGKPNIGTDAANYATFHHYFDTCTVLQPIMWITPDAPLVTSPAGLCLGSCP